MKARSMASLQYAANQFGMSNSDPKPKRGRRGGGGKDQEVSMSCSKDGCATYNTGGRSRVGEKTNRQNKGGAKGLSTRAQYSKQVLKPGSRKAKRWSKSIQKVKDNKPMSREQALYESDRRKF